MSGTRGRDIKAWWAGLTGPERAAWSLANVGRGGDRPTAELARPMGPAPTIPAPDGPWPPHRMRRIEAPEIIARHGLTGTITTSYPESFTDGPDRRFFTVLRDGRPARLFHVVDAGAPYLETRERALALVASCPHRGETLPVSMLTGGCCGGGPELTVCEIGKGERPGRVTLQECIICVSGPSSGTS